MRRLNSEITLYIFVFIAILPAIVVRDFTPANELRYMSIADEAIRDGHLFAFYIKENHMPTNHRSIFGL